MTTLDREAVIAEMAEALRKCLYTKTGNAIAAENVHVFERAAKALEAYRALPAQPVAVKPLTWEQPDGPDGTSYVGHGTDWCQFYIRKDGDEWLMPGDSDEPQTFETLFAAKAAAQADYEQRIRSVLAAPSQQEGLVQLVLREQLPPSKGDSTAMRQHFNDGVRRAAAALEAALVDRVKPGEIGERGGARQ